MEAMSFISEHEQLRLKTFFFLSTDLEKSGIPRNTCLEELIFNFIFFVFAGTFDFLNFFLFLRNFQFFVVAYIMRNVKFSIAFTHF